jgi:hypothetical protein
MSVVGRTRKYRNPALAGFTISGNGWFCPVRRPSQKAQGLRNVFKRRLKRSNNSWLRNIVQAGKNGFSGTSGYNYISGFFTFFTKNQSVLIRGR